MQRAADPTNLMLRKSPYPDISLFFARDNFEHTRRQASHRQNEERKIQCKGLTSYKENKCKNQN